jgi:hypothetical protein
MANVRKSYGLLRACGLVHGAAALLGACNWGNFDGYLDEAAIRVHATPKNYGSPRYGAVVATWSGKVDGETEVSRIFASGGADTAVGIAKAWNGSGISEATLLRCATAKECLGAADLGATLIPFSKWGVGSGQEHAACVFAPADKALADGAFSFVLCETNKVPQHFEAGLDEVDGSQGDLQFSGVGLPTGHPAGIVLVGAHVLDNRTSTRSRGGLYAQSDLDPVAQKVAPLAPVPLLDPSTGAPFSDAEDAGDLGRQVTGAVFADGTLVIAVAQPSQKRVIIASYDEKAEGGPLDKFVTRACIDSPDAALVGFGARVVLGDIDDDGDPELFIGNDPADDQQRGRSGLYMYSGRGLPPGPALDSCPPWGAEAEKISCPNVSGLDCGDSAFGASIAVGDVNGDRRGDLIVGAPRATVNGVAEAGAAYVIPSSPSGLDGAQSIALTQPAAGANFGASVAALRTAGRDEPVIGAPGDGALYVFMCTELEPGFGGTTLCLER